MSYTRFGAPHEFFDQPSESYVYDNGSFIVNHGSYTYADWGECVLQSCKRAGVPQEVLDVVADHVVAYYSPKHDAVDYEAIFAERHAPPKRESESGVEKFRKATVFAQGNRDGDERRAPEKTWTLSNVEIDSMPIHGSEKPLLFVDGDVEKETESDILDHILDTSMLESKNDRAPVQRPAQGEVIEVERLTQVNSNGIPSEWVGVDAAGEWVYLRFRSGHLQMRVGGEDGLDGETVVDIFVGRDWPGTYVLDSEVLDIVRAFDYVDIPEDVPELDEDELDEWFEALDHFQLLGDPDDDLDADILYDDSVVIGDDVYELRDPDAGAGADSDEDEEVAP